MVHAVKYASGNAKDFFGGICGGSHGKKKYMKRIKIPRKNAE